ncbi:MAG: chorismate synthase [Candidatus Marinimicrobia bacterium]|nr:chorismate synthase [Candidatus Neomarinimicrobiota bacterium]
MKYLTAGESHGKGLLGILEGIPAGLSITEEEIEHQLKRRQMGYGRGGRMKIEKDFAEIYSGVRYGKTIGSPIGLLIQNNDWVNWTEKMSVTPVKNEAEKITLPRPGHADLAGAMKYGFDDIRNVIERSSARETTMRVAIGAVCKKFLSEVGVEIGSRVVQISKATDESQIPSDKSMTDLNNTVDKSPVRAWGKDAEIEMMLAIDDARKKGNSVGGIFEVIATGCPYGLGSYVDADRKLHARIAKAIMSVNAFKGIEFGSGFGQAESFGSDVHDEIGFDGNRFTRPTNHAGGIEGGMSNAQPITIRVAMKPIPTLAKQLQSVDLNTKENKLAFKERTDSCAVPAASIIGEHMMGIILTDAILEKFGGDSMNEVKSHMEISAKY